MFCLYWDSPFLETVQKCFFRYWKDSNTKNPQRNLRVFCDIKLLWDAYKLFYGHIVFQGGVFLREKIKTFLSVCVLVIAIPYIVTLLFQGNGPEGESQGTSLPDKGKSTLTVEVDGQELEVEEYLAGIVALQMPLDKESEAIKAQAVIARTALLWAAKHQEELPKSMSREEMLELWGQDGFETNYQALESALMATEGEVLTWKGELTQPAFHAVSAGKTRKAKEALGTKIPYLKSVDSQMDIPASDYLKVIFLEKEELAETLKKAVPEANVDAQNVVQQISVLQRDSSDYALEVQVGETTMTGEEFRNCLGLNSACCYIKEVEGKVRIVTKGLGHGIGLSQYGANELAKEGNDYKEILQYYYKDVEITKENSE